jgi:hypothetical protein
MKKKDFIFWLRGYFTSIDKTKSLETIINELINEIQNLDINMTEKVIEKIIEKEINKSPFSPYNPYTPINPNPYDNPTVVMYGCRTSDSAYCK